MPRRPPTSDYSPLPPCGWAPPSTLSVGGGREPSAPRAGAGTRSRAGQADSQRGHGARAAAGIDRSARWEMESGAGRGASWDCSPGAPRRFLLPPFGVVSAALPKPSDLLSQNQDLPRPFKLPDPPLPHRVPPRPRRAASDCAGAACLGPPRHPNAVDALDTRGEWGCESHAQ